MLHGIEMNVIEVTQEVVLAAQRVLPISPLPNPALAFDAAAVGDWLAARQSMRKAAFDQSPARGEIRIAIGQGPDRMQVIRQDHGGVDGEGMPCSHLAKRGAQQSDVPGQQAEPAVGQVGGKEIAAAG